MSDRRQLAVIAVAAIGVTLLFFVFAFKPKVDAIAETRSEIEAAQQEESDLRAKLAELRAIQRGSVELAGRLQAVASYLPSSPNLPDFIRLVQTAATQSGVDLDSIAPSVPTDLANSTGIESITVTLVTRGGFHRVVDFLARLERLPRIVLVTALTLSPEVDPLSGRTVLSATITLRMFVVQPTARVGGLSTSASPSPEPSPGES